MVQILRHELRKQGNETVLFLYLDQSQTEFARELGSLDDDTKEDLNQSAKNYIQRKFPDLKKATVKIMVGGMLVSSFAVTAMASGLFTGDENRAYAAEVDYKGFADIKPDRESAPAIEALVKAGIIKGYPDGFHPGEDISRQHAAVMFVRAHGLDTTNVTDPGFKDVPTTHQYYKEIAAATAAGYFNKAENFNPTGEFTRGQSASVIVRSYGLEGDKTTPFTDLAGSGHEDAIGIMYNLGLAKGIGTTFKPNDNVTREQFAMLLHRTIEAKDTVDVVAALRSVNVTDTNKIEVSFSAPVVDTSKVTVQLKKGLANQYTTAKWADDKKSVALEAPADIPAGDYDVIVTGLGNEPIKETVKIEPEAAKSGEILNTSVAKVAGAKVSFNILNQYGTDMEVLANSGDLTFSVYNVTQGKSLTPTVTATKNEFSLDLSADADAKLDDKIRVIATYKGVTATKELTVVAASAIADIDLGTATLPKDAARFTVNTNDVKLPYTLKDQYGKDKKLTASQTGATIDGIRFLSSDTSIVDPASFATDANGDLTFDIGAKSGTVLITSIINATGDVSTTSVTVDASAGLKTVAITAPTTLISAGQTVTLGLAAVDQYGTAVTDLSGVNVTSSNPAVTGTIVNGKLQVVTTGTTAGTATLTLKNAAATETYGSVTVNYEAGAIPTAITSVDTPKALEIGATSEVKYSDIKVKDQYGRDYSLAANEVVGVTAVDGTFDVATVTPGAGIFTITTGTAAGTEAVKFALANGASVTVNFGVVAPTSISTYTVNDVGTLFAQGTTPNAKYNANLTLTGKTADGTSVVLANNKVTHATSSNQAVATVSNTGEVTGLTKGTSKVTLWAGANKLAEVTVNVDNATPVATTVTFDQTTALTTTVGGTLDLAPKLTVKDQYGVKFDTPEGFYASNDTSVATVDTTTGVVTGIKAGNATISYVTKNGISTTSTVEVR
jgi:trimeric autotransporter adhesin